MGLFYLKVLSDSSIKTGLNFQGLREVVIFERDKEIVEYGIIYLFLYIYIYIIYIKILTFNSFWNFCLTQDVKCDFSKYNEKVKTWSYSNLEMFFFCNYPFKKNTPMENSLYKMQNGSSHKILLTYCSQCFFSSFFYFTHLWWDCMSIC